LIVGPEKMKARITVLALVAVVSGFWVEMGSDIGLAINLIVRPTCLALLVSTFWRTSRCRVQVGILAGATALAETVACATYAVNDGLWYIISDAETQLGIIVFFAEQVILGSLLCLGFGRMLKTRMANKLPQGGSQRSAP
jgi:hypothetical protein